MRRIAKQVALTLAAIPFLFLMADAARTNRSPAEASSQAVNVDAAALFAKNCAKCHGKDGRAKTFRGKLTAARDFTNAEWQARVSDDTLAASVANGRGSMPSFRKKLSADEIKSLVAYIRGFVNRK